MKICLDKINISDFNMNANEKLFKENETNDKLFIIQQERAFFVLWQPRDAMYISIFSLH